MKIYLHELKETDTDLSFDENEGWVRDAVARVDEPQDERSAPPSKAATAQAPKKRPIQVHFNLRKVDDVVVLSGGADTSVRLVCSRCATPFSLEAHPQFSALFCRDPQMAGVGHLARAREHGQNVMKPMGQNKGYARHAHDEDASASDLDITYINEEYIDLADILTEQLTLLVPFQPLCKESCKGLCSNCGADQNLGRCACARLTTQRPFSVLKDLKI
jgi:uncharacterized protein